MKENMRFYDDFEFEPFTDLYKMKSKIENYQVEKQDKYGWQYVKGYVRCAFYFKASDRLLQALEKLLQIDALSSILFFSSITEFLQHAA